MAVLTLRSQRLLVDIVVQVTRIASRCERDLKYRFNVAIVAGNDFMTTEELVLCIFIVLENRLIPGDVAGVAGVTLIATVHFVVVIFKMTGHAGSIHLVFKRLFRMAIAASQFGMPAH